MKLFFDILSLCIRISIELIFFQFYKFNWIILSILLLIYCQIKLYTNSKHENWLQLLLTSCYKYQKILSIKNENINAKLLILSFLSILKLRFTITLNINLFFFDQANEYIYNYIKIINCQIVLIKKCRINNVNFLLLNNV